MENTSKYLTRISRYMDNQPLDCWVTILSITREPQKFINAIKYLIDYENKSYEFNGNYTKVRRICTDIPLKPSQKKEQLRKASDEKNKAKRKKRL